MSAKFIKLGTACADGFTLIELIVAIALMVMLVSVVVANFAGTSPARNLAVVHDELVSNVREMQSYATDNHNLPSGTPASSYQVVFSLASSASQHQYSLVGYDNAVTPNMVALSTQNLPSNLYVSSIHVAHAGGLPVSATQLTITYTLPYGQMVATYSGGASSATNEADDSVTIGLSSSNGSVTSTVTANAVTGGVQ
jgi:prepilin-type N-terminal cleavage/methylation domain-containing protein